MPARVLTPALHFDDALTVARHGGVVEQRLAFRDFREK
jgi:hypothetical protein